MHESAQARQQMQSFGDMVRPFQGMFASQGIQNPMQGVYNILQTTAQLQSGTPQSKAQAAADLVKQFGVGIKDLDDALVGNTANAQPSDPRYEELLTKFNNMEGRLQVQDTAAQHDVNTETAKFVNETPFANDVRSVMADFMEQASRNNQKLTLQESYDRAIATRPDIQTILANRKKVADSGQHVQQSRRAGVVVPIASEGGGAPVEPNNLRGALEQAWDNG